jgi:hypothetical protein
VWKNIADIWRNLIKDESAELLADSNNILSGWKNYFYRLLYDCGFNDVRQTEIRVDKA